jgi:hypothetical protein
MSRFPIVSLLIVSESFTLTWEKARPFTARK